MLSRRSILAQLLALAAAGGAAAQVKSGPQVGERPLPFTSNIVTGPERGKQHCYVCELKDEPAVLVFARKTDEPTARLMRDLRDAVQKHRAEKLFGWFVFLGSRESASQTALEQATYGFARQHGSTNLPISVLGDPQGPPGYLISPEADVTVLFFRRGSVVANRSFTAKEWTPRAAAAALQDLPKLLAAAPEKK
ncbi:MAG: hypothetical protein ACK47B_27050 [Armatimonadota bacterium]